MKKQITLRIDEDLLDWFKSKGKGYHKLMHKALEKYRMFNTPHIDVQEYYKDPTSEEIRAASDIEISRRKEAKLSATTNDQYFKPMPKTGKKKK